MSEPTYEVEIADQATDWWQSLSDSEKEQIVIDEYKRLVGEWGYRGEDV